MELEKYEEIWKFLTAYRITVHILFGKDASVNERMKKIKIKGAKNIEEFKAMQKE